MTDTSLERRLARFGGQLDAVADRRTAHPSPVSPTLVTLEETHRGGPRNAVRLVAVFVVVALALLVIVLVRGSATRPASSAPKWQRLDSRTAGFPRSVTGGVSGTVDNDFIALGIGQAWSSGDGRQWKTVSLPNNDRANLGGVITVNGRSVIWSYDVPSAPSPLSPPRMWATHDGTRWTQIHPVGLDNVGYLAIAGHATRFVATGSIANSDGTTSAAAWTSTDATKWKRATFQDGSLTGFGGVVWLDGRFIGLGRTTNTIDEQPSVWTSPNGTTWTKIADATPARLGSLYVPPDGSRVYGIQYETAGGSPDQGGTFGGRLMASPDGITWTEVKSFHDQLPVTNPDHILRTHGWWIVSGNTGTPDGKRRADIWMSPDLKHWTELPRHLQGKAGGGTGVPTAANSDTVVATALYSDHTIWIWRP